MRMIPIDSIPNQQFSVNIGQDRWTIRLVSAAGIMCADLLLNEQVILLGQRLVAGQRVIPYEHLSTAGNFLLRTEHDELPDWRLFGSTQTLLYLEPGE